MKRFTLLWSTGFVLSVLSVAPMSGQVPADGVDGGTSGPNLVLDHTSPHFFGDQRVGTSSPVLALTVTNDGDQALHITGVSKAATSDCEQFDVPNVTGTVDPPPAMDSVTIPIVFNPSERGSFSCQVTISSNDPDSPATPFVLNGTGVGSQLHVASGPLTFGGQRINTSSESQWFFISNVGDSGYDLTVGFIEIPISDDDEDWILTPPTQLTLPSGSSEEVGVVFRPIATGPQDAMVEIGSDADTMASGSIEVTGHGTTATLGLSPDPLNWPDVVVGQQIDRDITLSNTGDAPLTVSAIELVGGDVGEFQVLSSTPPPDLIIEAGMDLATSLRCSPTATGNKSTSLRATSDADNGSQIDATLNCTGVKPDLIVTPPPAGPITFSSTELGDTNSRTVTLEAANGPFAVTLTVSDVTISGSHSADFSNDAQAPFVLPPGDSTSFDVTFGPQQVGPRTAVLNLFSDDVETPHVEIYLIGVGESVGSIVFFDGFESGDTSGWFSVVP